MHTQTLSCLSRHLFFEGSVTRLQEYSRQQHYRQNSVHFVNGSIRVGKHGLHSGTPILDTAALSLCAVTFLTWVPTNLQMSFTHLFLALLVVMHVRNGRHHSSANCSEQDRSCTQANCWLAHRCGDAETLQGSKGLVENISRIHTYHLSFSQSRIPRLS